MKEAAWFERDEVAAAVQASRASPQAYLGDTPLQPGLRVPPPSAIAFSLMEAWLKSTAVVSHL